MKYRYLRKIKYNNDLFQIILRNDNKIGFLKIKDVGNKQTYECPTALEFLHLFSVLNVNNSIKF